MNSDLQIWSPQVCGSYIKKLPTLPSVWEGPDGVRKLQLTIETLPSINDRIGPGFHVKRAHREIEQLQANFIWAQVQICHWRPLESDRYMILCAVELGSHLKRDLDNSLKSSYDCLQKGGALYNDNRTRGLVTIYRPRPKRQKKVFTLFTHITILAFPGEPPLESFYTNSVDFLERTPLL